MMNRSIGLATAAALLMACGGDTTPRAQSNAGGGGAASQGGSDSTSQGGAATTTGAGGAVAGQGGAGGVEVPAIGLDCTQAGDALLCDDFESGSVDSNLWSTIERNGGTVSVDSDVVLDGGYALHISLPSAGGAEGALRAKDFLFPLPGNSMWGRAYIHAGPAVPNTHSKAITARGDLQGDTAQYRLDINGGDFNSRYTTPYIDKNIQHGGLRKFGYEVPANDWLCVEWHYDGMQHEMRYWFDGVAQDDMTVLSHEDPQWTAPAFDRFEIGWRTYQAATSANAFDIYYDAIVIDDERVGCAQ